MAPYIFFEITNPNPNPKPNPILKPSPNHKPNPKPKPNPRPDTCTPNFYKKLQSNLNAFWYIWKQIYIFWPILKFDFLDLKTII